MVIIISYNKQTWKEYNDNQTAHKNLANGAIISADKLNHMETGISNNDTNKVTDNKNGSIQVNGSSITPADDSKVVHSTDMRKPASDVVGLEDVPNGLYRGNLPENTDLSALTQEGIYNFATTLVNFIDSDYHWGTIQVINKSNVVSQCIICTSKFGNLGDQIFFRTRSGGSKTWHPWTMIPRFSMDNLLELPNGELLKPADDSKVVHSTDMRKPASDVAGIEEVNAKQDKIGYTPADDSKVVHSKDMRKPASDVAGIEEVNVKQDKIGYTPADASRVVHNTGAEEIAGQKTFDTAPIDKKTGNPYITKSNVPKVDLSNYVIDNKDNTIKANDVNYDLSKTGITPIGFVNSGSFNDLPLGTVLADANSMTDGPSKSNAFTTTTFSSSKWGGRKAQIAISDNVNLMYFRVEGYNGGSITWNSWVLLSDDSAVVHKTGTEEIAGQKTFTAAQTFSIAPTIKDASKDKGDNQAATMADLKSVKKSAWHIMSGSSDIFSTYNCWYKINKDKKRLEIIVLGIVQSNDGTVVDLSSIITSISRIDGTFNYFSNGQASGETPNYDGAEMRSYGDNMDSGCIAEIIHDSLNKSRVTANPAYIYYDGLQDAYK